MAGEAATRPSKLSLVVFSGAYDRVHYALVMASAALAVGTPVTLFLTMGASHALLAAHDGGPGWWGLEPPPGVTDLAAHDAGLVARGVAGFEELLEACISLEAKFMVCEMGLRALDLEAAPLRAGVSVEVGGVVSFLADAEATGQIIMV